MQSHAMRIARALVIGALLAGTVTSGSAGAAAAVPAQTRAGFAWGAGSAGALGTGTVAHALMPVPVRLPAGAVDIAVGATSAYAITGDGSVFAWGANDEGRLGDGTAVDSLHPVPVSFPAGTRISDVDVTGDHVLALADDGSVWAWGRNHRGQLGLLDTADRTTPARVALPGPAVAVAAGRDHSLALLRDGTVLAWGENAVGQLGTGALDGQSAPTVALAAGSHATAIAAGDAFGAALLDDGTVRVWGEGRLTGGTAAAAAEDVSHATGVVEIAAGATHLLARTGEGTLLAWGSDEHGQLGIPPDAERLEGPASSTTIPVTVPLPDVVGVSAGGGYSLALTSDGRLWSWGANEDGQLGDGTKETRATPAAVVALDGAEITAIDAGTASALVLVDRGPVAHLRVAPQTATVTAGSPQTFTVTGLDAFGTDVGLVAASLAIDGEPCDGLRCTPTAAGEHSVTAQLPTNATARAVLAPASLPVVGAARLTAVPAPGQTGGAGDPGGSGGSDGSGSGGSTAAPRGILGLTGGEAGGLAFVGAILTALGAAAVMMGRRRRAASVPHEAVRDARGREHRGE